MKVIKKTSTLLLIIYLKKMVVLTYPVLGLVLTRCINKLIEEKQKNDKVKTSVSGEDVREGLVAIISVKIPDPKFSSQTKDKLVTSGIKPLVEQAIYNNLYDYLLENPAILKVIIHKVTEAARARERQLEKLESLLEEKTY